MEINIVDFMWCVSRDGRPLNPYCTSQGFCKWVALCYVLLWFVTITLQWRHNGRDGVSNHQPHYCLLKRLFRRRSKKTSKLRVTGLCVGNSPGTGEFPAQMASNAENVSIWWRHHDLTVRVNSMAPERLFQGQWNKSLEYGQINDMKPI